MHSRLSSSQSCAPYWTVSPLLPRLCSASPVDLRTLLYDAGLSQCDALRASFLRLGLYEGEKREAVLRDTYRTSIAEVTDYEDPILAVEPRAVEGLFHSQYSWCGFEESA